MTGGIQDRLIGLPKKDLLLPDEVAAFLRIHRGSVYRMYNEDVLQGINTPGFLRIYRWSIVAYLEKYNGRKAGLDAEAEDLQTGPRRQAPRRNWIAGK